MRYVHSAVHASAPSYVKHPKLPFATGTYQPLIANNKTFSSADFKARHRAALYTHKASLCATPVRKSIYTPTVSVSSPQVFEDASAIKQPQNNQTPRSRKAIQEVRQITAATSTTPVTEGRGLTRVGRATVIAAKSAAHTIRNTATKVCNAWHTFTSLKSVQFIIKFFQRTHALWKKRMRFSYAFYAIVFTLLTSAEVIFLQWGVYSEPTYDKGDEVDQTTKILNSVAGQVTKFVSQIWLEQKYQFLLNFIGIGLIYLALVFVLNRFWIATVIFGAAMTQS